LKEREGDLHESEGKRDAGEMKDERRKRAGENI
jgi:hypothetical protein